MADSYIKKSSNNSGRQKKSNSVQNIYRPAVDTFVNMMGANVPLAVGSWQIKRHLEAVKKKAVAFYCGNAEKISVNNENEKVFSTDSKKEYGGNQDAVFLTRGDERKKIIDIIHKYYPNMSNAEVHDFLMKLQNEGCGYVALAKHNFCKIRR